MPDSQSKKRNSDKNQPNDSSWKAPGIDPTKEIIIDKGEAVETVPTVTAPNIDANPGGVDPWAPVYPTDTVDDKEPEEIYTPTKWEKLFQRLQDVLREQFNLDTSGDQRALAIVVTTTQGKIWNVVTDSTDDEKYKDWEIWSKLYVEAEVTKVKTAFKKNAARKNLDKPEPDSQAEEIDKALA